MEFDFSNTGRKGLANLGATCYINTATQCLSYCPDFLKFVLSDHYKIKPDPCLMDELRDIYIEMWKNNNSLIPRKYINSLHDYITEIDIYDQNDINEFLCFFIDKLNKGICYSISETQLLKRYTTKMIKTPYEIQCYRMDKAWHNQIGKEYSELINLFHGQSITQIICGQCKHITHNYEIFSSFELPLGGDNCNTLYDCLDLHFEEEYLNDENTTEWMCDECKNKYKSKKTIKLWRLPKIVIILLKRFTNYPHKNNKKITIPMIIDLEKYTLQKDIKSSFKLSAVAMQHGSCIGGHYYAICKHPDNKWYKIDDLNVCEENNLEQINYGYIFFYTSC